MDLTTLSGLLVLAGTSVTCSMKTEPFIAVNYKSDPIRYEYNYSSEELNVIRDSMPSITGHSMDTATGGLRKDQPKITINSSLRFEEYTGLEKGCAWYNEIIVDIRLSPEIYIANNFKDPICRSEIKRHELKHVDVDRRVMRKYASLIREDLYTFVHARGAVGPYDLNSQPSIQASMSQDIQKAVTKWEDVIFAELSHLQKNIDSIAEYKRISSMCYR